MQPTVTMFNHQTFHRTIANVTQPGEIKETAVVLGGSVYHLLCDIDSTVERPEATLSNRSALRAIMIGIHSIAAKLGTTPLEAMAAKWSKKHFDFYSNPNLAANFEYLKVAIQGYYDFRYSETHGYPSAYDSATFLLTEVGELLSELLQATGKFIRNNPEKSQGQPIIWELGDVYQMFLVTCIQLDVDPFENL